MNGAAKAFGAIGAAFGDVFSSRLGWLAALCVTAAIALTAAAAWAAFRYLVPMIPEGAGWMRWLYDGAEILASAGVVVLAVLIAPAISMVLGGALFDVAAERVEKTAFAGQSPGRGLPLHQGLAIGLRIGLPALALNLLSLPLLFVPVVNLVWFLGLNGYLMGREYSSMAAVRAMSWEEARAFRRRHAAPIFLIGLACSFIPFIAPLIGASAMTRFVRAAYAG